MIKENKYYTFSNYIGLTATYIYGVVVVVERICNNIIIINNTYYVIWIFSMTKFCQTGVWGVYMSRGKSNIITLIILLRR